NKSSSILTLPIKDIGTYSCMSKTPEYCSERKHKTMNMERGPKYAFKTRSDSDVLEDGCKWGKYGKKSIKNNPHP
ncbi:hypothetical protein KI387_007085, partial [Taxus chinensis]